MQVEHVCWTHSPPFQPGYWSMPMHCLILKRKASWVRVQREKGVVEEEKLSFRG